MIKTLIYLFLIVVIAGGMPAGAADRNENTLQQVKDTVAKIGTGEKSKVKVQLSDGTKIEGHIGQIGENDFVVVNRKSGESLSIAYAEVAKVKGKGMSTAAKVAIIASAGLGAVLIWMAAAGFWSD